MEEGSVRYVLIDSSPQFHRDYELVLTKSIRVEHLVSLWKLSTSMLGRWAGDACLAEQVLDEDRRAAERAEMDEICSKVVWHASPVAEIGFGAASVARRLHAVMHCLRLELSDYEQLHTYWGEVLCICSDYGTEYLVSGLEPVPDPFPYWRDGTESEVVAEDDLLVEPARPARPDLHFNHLLANDGLLHTIDNCTADLAGAMVGFRVAIRKLKAVCKLIRTKSSQDKLLTRCFQDAVGVHFAPQIRQFQGAIHEGRWGSIAFSIPQLRKLEHVLRYGWDLQKFLGSAMDNQRRTILSMPCSTFAPRANVSTA